jgi:putative ATP-binding cassette transporter
MMVAGAFNQVQSSLRWFVDNLPQIADWRATLLRVVAFRDALAVVDTIGADTGRIEVVESASDRLELDNLQLALPEVCVMLDQDRVEISPGERIQIIGEAASGKSTLFRALAGMWPWGSGTLRLPPRKAMTFMPQRPYLPLGTLRAAVCYPAGSGQFDATAVVAALERVDLGHLIPSLDRTERWDRQLPLDEQQRLAFARLLLHAPRWVIADDALSALGDSHRRRVLSFCDRELVGMTLIRLGRDPVLNGFWSRTLHTVERTGGPHLRTNQPPQAEATDALPAGSSRNSAAVSIAESSAADDRRPGT